MDAANKVSERLLEWFRVHAKEDGVRIYDDDGASIGVDGHINVCKLVTYLLHGNVTHTPGPPPETEGAVLSGRDLVQAALQNLPDSLVNGKALEKQS